MIEDGTSSGSEDIIMRSHKTTMQENVVNGSMRCIQNQNLAKDDILITLILGVEFKNFCFCLFF